MHYPHATMRNPLIGFTVILGLAMGADAQDTRCIVEDTSIVVESDSQPNDSTGFAVALDGPNRMIVGNRGRNESRGGASVYRRGVDGWILEQRLEDLITDLDPGDWFGSFAGLSGRFAAVSAANDDPNGNAREKVGSVYVFEETNPGHWMFHTKLFLADGIAQDRYGDGLDVYSGPEGTLLVIGVPGRDLDDDPGSGWVYFHRLNPITNEWELEYDFTVDENDPVFYKNAIGNAIAIDGNKVLVGADSFSGQDRNGNRGPDTGRVFNFHYNETLGIWEQGPGLDPGSIEVFNHFGWSVDLDGDFAIVGAINSDEVPRPGHVYMFRYDVLTNQWILEGDFNDPVQDPFDWFGQSVAIAGRVAYASNYRHNGENQGRAYGYLRDTAGNWLRTTEFASNEVADSYGYAIACSETNVAIGAPNTQITPDTNGAVYESTVHCTDWDLDVTNLTCGEAATFSGRGGPANTKYVVLWSLRDGIFIGEGADYCVHFYMELPLFSLHKRILVEGTFDADGSFEENVFIPSYACGIEIRLQGAAAHCPDRMSNMVTRVIAQ